MYKITFRELIAAYLERLRVRGYSQYLGRRDGRRNALEHFAGWCEARGMQHPQTVTRAILERYQRHLSVELKRGGGKLHISTQRTRLVYLRGYFRYGVRAGYLNANPASELELPRRTHRLPRDVMSVAEVEAVMGAVSLATLTGLRDRTILELLYATGLRRAEVVSLDVSDVDTARLTVFVREGKGKKDRVVPLGERGAHWVMRYRDEARAQLETANEREALFLGTLGERISADGLSYMVRNAIGKAVGKRGSCHLFRHTMATLLLEGGADIRHVQEILGHSNLDTTAIYTRVSVARLLKVHERSHPGSKLVRAKEKTD